MFRLCYSRLVICHKPCTKLLHTVQCYLSQHYDIPLHTTTCSWNPQRQNFGKTPSHILNRIPTSCTTLYHCCQLCATIGTGLLASQSCGMQPVWLEVLDLHNLRLNRLWPWFPGKGVPHTVSDVSSGRRPVSTGQLA